MKRKLLMTLVLASLTFGVVQLGLGKTNQAELPDYLMQNERNTIEVFRKAAPLVVFVNNIRTYVNFFSFDSTQVNQGAGSGFIWDDDGHIITNYHVIEGADEVSVTLQNGTVLNAAVVGKEPRKDIAVLKVDKDKLPKNGFLNKLADSSSLIVGQKTIAIGNPFGLDHTMTSGIVSALGRSFPGPGGVTIRDMVQTDAAINPGNSGGPLLDSRGHLIGMNTAIYSQSGSSAGIGFAVPADTIKRVAKQIIKFGRVIDVGIGFQPFPPHYQQQLGFEGVMVWYISKKNSARTGLKGSSRDRYGRVVPGDIIKGIDGERVRSYDDLYNLLEGKKPGDEVTLIVKRGNKEIKKRIELILLK